MQVRATILSRFSDTELLLKLQAGDSAAFEELYKRHWAKLFRHAFKMLQNEEEAKDVIQDVFITLWSKSSELNVNTSLTSYLHAAVRYKIFDLFDKNKVKTDYLYSLEKFVDGGTYVTDDAVRERELVKAIEVEINLLPEKMRAVFEFSRKHNFSYKQISTQMNISENTVKKQISNALKILRVKLGAAIFIFISLF